MWKNFCVQQVLAVDNPWDNDVIEQVMHDDHSADGDSSKQSEGSASSLPVVEDDCSQHSRASIDQGNYDSNDEDVLSVSRRCARYEL